VSEQYGIDVGFHVQTDIVFQLYEQGYGKDPAGLAAQAVAIGE
jgi:hypothetical protein